MSEYEGWSVEKRLTRARAMLVGKNIKKTGKNRQKYQDKKTGEWKEAIFYYFELSDFLPETLIIFDEVGLCGKFSIIPAHTEIQKTGDNQECKYVFPEIAELKISNADDNKDFIIFREPTADVEMRSAIQSLGAKKTYLRRYLWIDAMEIAENDQVDAQRDEEDQNPANEKETAKYQTPNKQVTYNPAQMAIDLTSAILQLREIDIDVHDEIVSSTIKRLANVDTIDGGKLLSDLPAMARVIDVMRGIYKTKKAEKEEKAEKS